MVDAENAADGAAIQAGVVEANGLRLCLRRIADGPGVCGIDALAVVTAVPLAAGGSTAPFDLPVRRVAVRTVNSRSDHGLVLAPGGGEGSLPGALRMTSHQSESWISRAKLASAKRRIVDFGISKSVLSRCQAVAINSWIDRCIEEMRRARTNRKPRGWP